MPRSFATPCLLALMAGCASTDMRTFTDPDFKDYACKHLLVFVGLPHLDQRAEAEGIFIKQFKGTDTTCSKALDILPPTRKYEAREMEEVLHRAGISCVLLVRETQYYEDKAYVPEYSTTNMTGQLQANTYYHGNMANTYGSMNATGHTTKYGGYYVSKPRVRHELELFDVATQKVVWMSGAFTRGNSRAGFETLVTSLAGETAKMLKKDGLVHEETAMQPRP